jgi:hypothetical protein
MITWSGTHPARGAHVFRDRLAQLGRPAGLALLELHRVGAAQLALLQAVPQPVREQREVELARAERLAGPELVQRMAVIAAAPARERQRRGGAGLDGLRGPGGHRQRIGRDAADVGARAVPGDHEAFRPQLLVDRHDGVARDAQRLGQRARRRQPMCRRHGAVEDRAADQVGEPRAEGLLAPGVGRIGPGVLQPLDERVGAGTGGGGRRSRRHDGAPILRHRARSGPVHAAASGPSGWATGWVSCPP